MLEAVAKGGQPGEAEEAEGSLGPGSCRGSSPPSLQLIFQILLRGESRSQFQLPKDPLKRGWLTCSLAVLAHGQDWSSLRRKWSFRLLTETDVIETGHVLTDRPGWYRQKTDKC